MRQEGHRFARTLGVAALAAVSTGAAALGGAAACGRTVPILDASADAAPDAGRPCLYDLDCQDGLACDGAEVCGPDLLCAPGPLPACDDAVLCTDDACAEPGGCSNVPNHGNCPPGSLCLAGLGCTVVPCTGAADCQDAFFCNGSELCEKGSCTVGPEPTCQDFIDCTDDACDEAARTCAHVPLDAACSDGLWCNGAERCLPPLGCGPGPLPPCGDGSDCTEDSCDEALAACVNTPVDHDGDGFPPVPCGGGDCNDDAAEVRPGAPEVCTGGIDDDCDALSDCADPDCAADPVCAPPPACLPAALLACGGADARANDGPGATSVLADYGCGPLGRTATETIYAFTPASGGAATFTLGGLTADLDLFVLAAGPGGACDPALCLAAAAGPGPAAETLSLAVTAGAAYHVVVDGPPGSFSFYDLGVACGPAGAEACDDDVDNDLDGAADCLDADCAAAASCAAAGCLPAATADCTTVTAGNNGAPGATDLLDAYGGACAAGGEEGPEIAYAFTAGAPGFAAAFVEGLTADLDLFVLAAGPAPGGLCDPDACLASGTGPGASEGVVFAVAAGQTYYVVVDGALGAVSDYELWLFCSAP